MKFFLQDFLDFIPENLILKIFNFKNQELVTISGNSNNIVEKSGFIAIKGVAFDGEKFIDTAINKGAKVIFFAADCQVWSKNYPDVCFVQVANDRKINSLACQFLYGKDLDKLQLLGVTGTNGKTTTAYLFYQILSKLDRLCGLISTVQYFDGKNFSESNQTTPAPEKLFLLLKDCVENNCQYVPMEISSHSLAQFRLGNLKFKSLIFTNLTGDHLDFHGDMESYYQVKKSGFVDYAELAIINKDDPFGARLAEELKTETNLKIITFGEAADCDYQIKIIPNEKCSRFLLNGIEFISNLLGRYNVYNLTGVVIALNKLGFPMAEIAQVIAGNNFNVPGRLELITLKKGVRVFIDYAHTDDALQNVLRNLKQLPHKRLITVFGCGGNRDQSKRSRMGTAAETYSDYVFVTSDNPRFESPKDIIEDIKSGLKNKLNYEIIENRAAAIRKSLAISENGDIVLIAGKGHEKYQEINGEKLYFSDSEEVMKFEGEE